MADNKRSISVIADMDTSSRALVSKKRKPAVAGSGSASSELELCSSVDRLRSTHLWEGLHDMTVSPASSVSSAGTVLSGRSFSCCSSNVVKTSSGVVNSTTPPPPQQPDLEAKGFETVESTCSDIKLFRRDMYLLSESFGDSEETMTLQVKSPPAVLSKQRNIPVAKMAPKEEIEEFFAMAEKYEQERFAEKYNYDIAKDMPLDGRYQWVRLN
ncbi:cyclin-dependent kinase inhibitor 7-like [Neltuma alba]|uniref:cyclin-dependent kinase inhibitor 7-like n=1 Tax=Neltuma alba TaxID=207710 RepID=UPI0010A32739|nr:cyclin-dependent kinase inhibitor 7-like [Prosopis alba]XP_028797293.1 cyclin-dependent kinase inhibitor 7-like [Prosopis alba]